MDPALARACPRSVLLHRARLTRPPARRYSKRATLSGVYAATEVFMLTDYSPGLADTWQALDRRLEDVRRLGKLAAQVRWTRRDQELLQLACTAAEVGCPSAGQAEREGWHTQQQRPVALAAAPLDAAGARATAERRLPPVAGVTGSVGCEVGR